MKHTRETVIKNTVAIKEAGKVLAIQLDKEKFFASKKEFEALQAEHLKWEPVTVAEKLENVALTY